MNLMILKNKEIMPEIYFLIAKLCSLDEDTFLSTEETVKMLSILLQNSGIWRKIIIFALVLEEQHKFEEKIIEFSINKKELLVDLLSIDQTCFNNEVIDEQMFFAKLYSNIRALNNNSKPLASLCFLSFEESSNEEFLYKIVKILGHDTSILKKQSQFFSSEDNFQVYRPLCSQNKHNYNKTTKKNNDSNLANEISRVIEKCDVRLILKFNDWKHNIYSPYIEKALKVNCDNQEEIFEELKEINNINKLISNYLGISLIKP